MDALYGVARRERVPDFSGIFCGSAVGAKWRRGWDSAPTAPDPRKSTVTNVGYGIMCTTSVYLPARIRSAGQFSLIGRGRSAGHSRVVRAQCGS